MAEENNKDAMMSKDRKEPGAFTEMLMKAFGKKRELTPSERIVSLAKERDLTYDLIQAKKEELETLKENDDRENAAYLEEDIKMLCKRKDFITKRMNDLLDKT